jgi:uncharacterized protein YjbI with pentapeptide repeats
MVAQGVVGIAGIDTRAVVRHIRERGAMKAGIFSGADLSGADLTDADLTGADLSGADLCDTNLEGAQLDLARLKKVRRCAGTRWPAGFTPPPERER